MTKSLQIKDVRIGGRNSLVFIAGPCVIESRKGCLALAQRLVQMAGEEGCPLIFKASYDKANRSAHTSFRGPGLEEGLDILAEVKSRYGVALLTDVHTVEEVGPAAAVVDVLQIPAFLCRQTDLLMAAGRTRKPVNIKKGQFLAPEDMRHVVAKVEATRNRKILVTERGASFGYHNLVADMRSLPMLSALGYPVVFDATHSVQRPGGAGARSSGDAELAPVLARAAVAAGCDGVFLETHLRPEEARSDKDNAIRFSRLRKLWRQLREIHEVVH